MNERDQPARQSTRKRSILRNRQISNGFCSRYRPSRSDSPEARRYNRIRRWLGVADFVLALHLMVALLATGWSGALRDIAYKATFQHYRLAVFLYVLMLMMLSKVSGMGLDYYSFRLEHRYQLSNQRSAGLGLGRD